MVIDAWFIWYKSKVISNKNIINKESSGDIAELIDTSLLKATTLKILHEEIVYKEGKIYKVTLVLS